MNSLEVQKLATAWIALQNAPQGSSEHRKHFWAFEKLTDVREEEPEVCWIVINEIRKLDGSDKILASVASGPLEDLLVSHGPMFIARVEHLASTDPQFRKLLGALWQNDISDEIWGRVRAVAGPTF
jgi:hypothetical protein